MRTIKADTIKNAVARLCIQANVSLPADILRLLKSAQKKETKARAKKILKVIIDNAEIAKRRHLAICQDTGLAVVFVELGQGVRISGGALYKTINEGIGLGYRQGYFRNSVVRDPVLRGEPGFIPAVIHIEIVPGDKLKLTILPKGFGCENKSAVKMFKPTSKLADIKEFVINTVKDAGPDACPPFVIGIGIGGTQDYACLLAKKALLRKEKGARHQKRCQAPFLKVAKLEKELLSEINRLNIGPMGLGGETTCLKVNIETYPTHIAGLPVCVNISCHAMRSASAVL